MSAATDLDGSARILLGAFSLIVDIGAYEHMFSIAITETAENNVELSWNTRSSRTYTILSTLGLATPWVEETTMPGDKSGSAAWIDIDPACTCKFYRIEIE